jgi:hypothetical protein
MGEDPAAREHREWVEEFDAAARRPLRTRLRYAFIHTYKPVLDDARYARSTAWPNIARGAPRTCRPGWAMAPRFEYAQAEEVRDAFARDAVRYLFIGKSGAILLGYPDTTQDADLFVEKGERNGLALARALRELGFDLSESQADEIRRGKDFVQLKNGPFDLDLVFAPNGIESFEDA